jgi:mercuric ion transport protein
MRDGTLIATGGFDAGLAALCCMTPLLGIVLGAIGLTGWLAKADYMLIPAVVLFLALLVFGLCRRHLRQR